MINILMHVLGKRMLRAWKGLFYRLMLLGILAPLAGCFSGLPVGTSDGGGNTPIEAALGLQTQVLDSTPAPACVQFGQPASNIHKAMLDALNAYRAQKGLKPLIYSKMLESAANAHLEDCWDRGFFAHVNPDGKDPGQRALDAGFCHEYVGENLAAGQSSVDAAMLAWKNSPGHDANMVEPEYVYVGMGYYIDSNGRQYWGQEFAYDVPQ